MRRLVAGALLGLTPVLAAAQGLTGSIGATAGAVRTRSLVGTTSEVASGAVIGAEGHVGLGRVSLDLAYLQGSLNGDVGGTDARDYVEGDAFLSVVTFPGVILRVGPHARAYISEVGTQRWLFWTARVRGEFSLITSPSIKAFAEGWLAWNAEVNVSEQFDRARGAIVGMTLRFPRSLFYGKLAYGIEQGYMGAGARVEDVEGITLTIGFGRR